MGLSEHHAVADVLLRIESEMRQCGLWSKNQPSETALQSIQPFCIDTMGFNEWLQFIFIPKMKKIIEDGHLLPSSCDISAMAEESFALYMVNTHTLLNLLIECDEILMARA